MMKNLKSRFLKKRNKLQQVANPTEAPVQLFTQEYITAFLHPTCEVAGQRQSIYINKEHHTLIIKIIRTIGGGKVTIGEYVSNVLTEHFATFKDEITELYDKQDKNIF